MATLTLRDYQLEARTAILQDWREVDRTLAVLATGTGKTVIFLSLLDALRESEDLERALIIAHRRELIHQPVEKAHEMFPDLAPIGIVMADHDQVNLPIVVATIQTLNAGDRLARILAHGAFSHVVVDECHHATADTYRAILDQLPGRPKVLGVTATPLRTDGDGLSRVFQRVSYRLPISAAIRRGALVPFDALGVQLPISFVGLKQTDNGWEREALGDLLRAQNVLEIVHQKWVEYCTGRQTIAFTASVAQARETAAYLSAQGIKAEWVSGETPKRDRDRILKAYQSGEINVVCNCMVLTEGFDAPETSAVLMIAPTKSDLIYVQRLGRGLRLADGKTDCRVLDFAPVEERNVVMAGDVLGKPRDVRKAETSARQSGVLCALSVNQFGEAATIDPSRLIVKILNLLKRDALAWTLDGVYATATISADETICIILPDAQRLAKGETLKRAGEFVAGHTQLFEWLSDCRLYIVNGNAKFKGRFKSFDEAKAVADELSLDKLDKTLANKKGHWRTSQPSDKQLRLMAKLKIEIPADCTKGQAAQLITHTVAKRVAERADRHLASRHMTGRPITQEA